MLGSHENQNRRNMKTTTQEEDIKFALSLVEGAIGTIGGLPACHDLPQEIKSDLLDGISDLILAKMAMSTAIEKEEA